MNVQRTFAARAGATVPNRTVHNQVRGTRIATQSSAAAQIPWNGQDGAVAWAEYSPYPREAGIAGRRFAAYAGRLPLPALWYAVAEAALEGHHAAGSCVEAYLRSRCARIGETLREIEKREESEPVRRRGVMRSLADILGGVA